MTPIFNVILTLWLFGAQMPTFAPIASPSPISVAKTPIVGAVDTKNPIKSEERTEKVTVSAYTAIETCKNTSCIMASGKKAYVGAAACPRKYPLGTKLELEGMGTFTCEDRTAKKYDGRFDLFFGYDQSDYQRAINFGIQKKKITIL